MATTAGWYPHPDDPTKELHFDGSDWGDSRVLRFQRDKPAQTDAAGWYPHPTQDDTQVHFDGRAWSDTRVLQRSSLQLSGPSGADGSSVEPVYVSPEERPAPPAESRSWSIAKAALSFGPIIAIAVIGLLAIVSGGNGS